MSFDEKKHIYPISVVAKMMGVSTHTLRSYESAGLIETQRQPTNSKKIPAGRRMYSDKDVEHLKNIKHFIDSGLSILAVKLLLEKMTTEDLLERLKQEK